MSFVFEGIFSEQVQDLIVLQVEHHVKVDLPNKRFDCDHIAGARIKCIS